MIIWFYVWIMTEFDYFLNLNPLLTSHAAWQKQYKTKLLARRMK